MSGIYVRHPEPNTKAPELYVTPATTDEQYSELLEDMRVLYQGHSRRNGWQGPLPAAAAAAAFSTAATVAAAAAGRTSIISAQDPAAAAASAEGAAETEAEAEAAGAEEDEASQLENKKAPTWTLSVCAQAQANAPEQWFRVEATDSMTVRLLKRELVRLGLYEGKPSGTSLAAMRIFDRQTELLDHCLVPAADGATLRVLLPDQQPPSHKPTFTLFVKTLAGLQFEVTECGPWSFVGELKAAAGERLHVPPSSLRLIFAGKQLEGDSTLESYNLADEATINCVQRLGV